jgi:hypothetical protein
MSFTVSTRRECARAWDAMPWVLQHTASAEQTEWLASHLAECASCRAEYERQSFLQQAMQLPPDITLDANAGLKRLLDRLDAHDTEAATPAPVRARAGGWLTRALVAAVLLQAVGIGILGMKLRNGENPAYRTFSQTSTAVAPAGAIHVVPDAGMTLADWNTAMRALHLQVIDGPNDVGAYTVAPTVKGVVTADILRQLRATRGIRMAEPVAEAP